MSIRNVLVSLEVLSPPTSALGCAVALAERLGASVSGFAAAQPWGELSYTGLGPAAAAVLDRQRGEIEEAIDLAEEHFRTAVPEAMRGRFQGIVDAPTNGLVEAAATADLIVLPPVVPEPGNTALRVDAGAVVMGSGRPVLMLGEQTRVLPLRHVLVAWKDTREARRAVADALPLLRLAEHVDVVSVDEGEYGSERAELLEVMDWFRAHRIDASHDILPREGAVAEVIAAAAETRKCDLVISGGYGHTRLREWLFGGVTNDLLGARRLNRLMSN